MNVQVHPERILLLIRSCKKINIKDPIVVLPWVRECVLRHFRRKDFKYLLYEHGMTKEDYISAVGGNKELLEIPISNIAIAATETIRNRVWTLPPPKIEERMDRSIGKLRMIGDATAMQQVFDYIAVGSCEDIFRRRIVPQQVSSISGRGPLYGMRMIKNWVEKDNRSIRYAKNHHIRYTSKCRYFVKLDVTKCFPTARKERFLELFSRDCGNEDILWLWDTLLSSHRVGGYQGFMIGSLASQWACQYMTSFLYRHAMSLHKYRRGKSLSLVSHMLVYMDDLLLQGSSRKDLMISVRSLITYAKEFLGFTIKKNWHIQDFNLTSIDMVGFVIHRSGKVSIRDRDFIRSRRIILRNKRKGLSLRQSKRLTSYKGYYKYSNSRKMIEEFHIFEIFNKAANIISKYVKEGNNNVANRNLLLQGA